jgi:hypothetical protein
MATQMTFKFNLRLICEDIHVNSQAQSHNSHGTVKEIL